MQFNDRTSVREKGGGYVQLNTHLPVKTWSHRLLHTKSGVLQKPSEGPATHSTSPEQSSSVSHLGERDTAMYPYVHCSKLLSAAGDGSMGTRLTAIQLFASSVVRG